VRGSETRELRTVLRIVASWECYVKVEYGRKQGYVVFRDLLQDRKNLGKDFGIAPLEEGPSGVFLDERKGPEPLGTRIDNGQTALFPDDE
jgi:hypothetical protein